MQPPPWSRAATSGSRAIITTMSTQKRVAVHRRASTGNSSYREPSAFSSDYDDEDDLAGTASTSQPTPALKEARDKSKNNLRLAWESIFTRYTQGQHLAAGRDDVFDFGTGEIVEDAGFLDDFVVDDDEQRFEGRSIEIGDFGLPGAIGMGNLTESSSEEEEMPTPSRSRRGSTIKSEGLGSPEDTDLEEGSGDDLQLESSPSRRSRQAAMRRQQSQLKQSRRGMSRSVSMPESVDLLSSSSDDDMGQRDVQPVSERYKEIKRIRTSMKEDLKEFEELELARQAKEAAERVKRERTCTPFLASPNVAHLRAGSIRPLPRSAPSAYTPYVSSSLARNGSVTPVKSRAQQRYPTPSASTSRISIKPESSDSAYDIKPFRASSMRPQGRSFSIKPSSSSSMTAAHPEAISAIPLGHYSNTLLNQAVACEEDSSDDDIAMRTPVIRVKRETSITRPPSSWKGKERAKEEDINDPGYLKNGTPHTSPSHLPSPPPSRTQHRKKRSPSFYSSPTASNLPPPPRPQALRPVVEIYRSPGHSMSHRKLPADSAQQRIIPHSAPRVPANRSVQYTPKQSSPLKGSPNQLRQPRCRASPPPIPHGVGICTPILLSSDSSEDEAGNMPLRMTQTHSSHTFGNFSPSSPPEKLSQPARQVYTSPNKRKHSALPASPESPSSRARLALPVTRNFAFAPSPLPSPAGTTPSASLAKMSLVSSQKSFTSPARRPKEETPDALAISDRGSIRSGFIKEESVRPVLFDDATHVSHLPTPPLSSGSTTGYSDKIAQTPGVKSEDEDFFKVPSPPKQQRSPANSNRNKPVTLTPSAALYKGKSKAKPESPNIGYSSDDDDDEIMLVSPLRPTMTRREHAPPSPYGKGYIRADTRMRAVSVLQSKPARASSIMATTPKASPTVTRSTPPQIHDGYESDDPLGI